jgi:hypothetical protein
MVAGMEQDGYRPGARVFLGWSKRAYRAGSRGLEQER